MGERSETFKKMPRRGRDQSRDISHRTICLPATERGVKKIKEHLHGEVRELWGTEPANGTSGRKGQVSTDFGSRTAGTRTEKAAKHGTVTGNKIAISKGNVGQSKPPRPGSKRDSRDSQGRDMREEHYSTFCLKNCANRHTSETQDHRRSIAATAPRTLS